MPDLNPEPSVGLNGGADTQRSDVFVIITEREGRTRRHHPASDRPGRRHTHGEAETWLQFNGILSWPDTPKIELTVRGRCQRALGHARLKGVLDNNLREKKRGNIFPNGKS